MHHFERVMSQNFPARFIAQQLLQSLFQFGRIAYFTELRRRLETDLPLRRYFEQETQELPEFFTEQVRRDLGPFFSWLPPGGLEHDPNAYLMSETVRPSLRAAPA